MGQTDRDDRCDPGESDALQQWKADSDVLESDRLDDRRDAAGEQVCGDQQDEFFTAETERAGDQDRHQHRARVERDDVLEAVGGKLGQGKHLVNRVHAFALVLGGCRHALRIGQAVCQFMSCALRSCCQ